MEFVLPTGCWSGESKFSHWHGCPL